MPDIELIDIADSSSDENESQDENGGSDDERIELPDKATQEVLEILTFSIKKEQECPDSEVTSPVVATECPVPVTNGKSTTPAESNTSIENPDCSDCKVLTATRPNTPEEPENNTNTPGPSRPMLRRPGAIRNYPRCKSADCCEKTEEETDEGSKEEEEDAEVEDEEDSSDPSYKPGDPVSQILSSYILKRTSPRQKKSPKDKTESSGRMTRNSVKNNTKSILNSVKGKAASGKRTSKRSLTSTPRRQVTPSPSKILTRNRNARRCNEQSPPTLSPIGVTEAPGHSASPKKRQVAISKARLKVLAGAPKHVKKNVRRPKRNPKAVFYERDQPRSGAGNNKASGIPVKAKKPKLTAAGNCQTRLTCSKCPARFKSKFYMAYHFRAHGAKLSCKCQYCDFACHRSYILASHERLHVHVQVPEDVTPDPDGSHMPDTTTDGGDIEEVLLNENEDLETAHPQEPVGIAGTLGESELEPEGESSLGSAPPTPGEATSTTMNLDPTPLAPHKDFKADINSTIRILRVDSIEVNGISIIVPELEENSMASSLNEEDNPLDTVPAASVPTTTPPASATPPTSAAPPAPATPPAPTTPTQESPSDEMEEENQIPQSVGGVDTTTKEADSSSSSAPNVNKGRKLIRHIKIRNFMCIDKEDLLDVGELISFTNTGKSAHVIAVLLGLGYDFLVDLPPDSSTLCGWPLRDLIKDAKDTASIELTISLDSSKTLQALYGKELTFIRSLYKGNPIASTPMEISYKTGAIQRTVPIPKHKLRHILDCLQIHQAYYRLMVLDENNTRALMNDPASLYNIFQQAELTKKLENRREVDILNCKIKRAYEDKQWREANLKYLDSEILKEYPMHLPLFQRCREADKLKRNKFRNKVAILEAELEEYNQSIKIARTKLQNTSNVMFENMRKKYFRFLVLHGHVGDILVDHSTKRLRIWAQPDFPLPHPLTVEEAEGVWDSLDPGTKWMAMMGLYLTFWEVVDTCPILAVDAYSRAVMMAFKFPDPGLAELMDFIRTATSRGQQIVATLKQTPTVL